MTATERRAVLALAQCRFAPATWDKKFARDMASRSADYALSPKQRESLWRLVQRYRRQLPAEIVRLRPMTKSEWLASEDPQTMLSFLQGEDLRGHRLYPASDSKLRLVCHALLRPISDYPGNDYPSRPLDWLIGWMGPSDSGNEELCAILRDVFGNPFRPVTLPVSPVKCRRCNGSGEVSVQRADYALSRANGYSLLTTYSMRDRCSTCDGTGVRVPRTGDPEWACPWLTETVRSLAERAYQERDWDALPIVADALLDAGCPEDSELVKHLRGLEPCWLCARTNGTKRDYCSVCNTVEYRASGWAPLRGPHVRGCHTIDLLTGRV